MPGGTVLQRLSVPAGGSIDFLADTEYEFPPDSPGDNYAFAVGAEATGCLLTIKYGQVLRGEDLNCTVLAAGVNPKLPDDAVHSSFAAAGAKVKATIENTTGAAIIATLFVEVTGPNG